MHMARCDSGVFTSSTTGGWLFGMAATAHAQASRLKLRRCDRVALGIAEISKGGNTSKARRLESRPSPRPRDCSAGQAAMGAPSRS
jgi:hypothetical protein